MLDELNPGRWSDHPPWEAKTDFDLFHLLAGKLSDLARTHLGVRHDLVSVPLQHDTPGETAVSYTHLTLPTTPYV